MTIKKRLGSLVLPNGAALESLGVTIAWGKGELEIWNIYRPPARQTVCDNRDAQLYLDLWPHQKDVLICSDANCHGSWDENCLPDKMGEEVEDWMAEKGLMLLNNAPTRISAHGKESAPDISIVATSKAHIFNWTPLDSIGSDHLPLLISTENVKIPNKAKPQAKSQENGLESLHLSLRRKVLDELAEAITGSGCQTLRQLHAVRDKGIDTIFLWENP